MVRLAAMSEISVNRSASTDLTIAIVADDPLARAGLAMLLGAEPDLEIMAQMSLADWLADLQTEAAFNSWPDQALDGVIWDVGWESVGPLPDEEPFPLPVVALLPDETAVPQLWSLGIHSMLQRDATPASIVAALRTAMQGVAALDPIFVTAVLADPDPTHNQELDTVELTPREMDVLHLLAEGLTNKTIAHQLAISDHTVKFHVNAILSKLNAQSRTEAVVQATRLGLLLL